MRIFKETVDIKLNLGEVSDLLMVYEPVATGHLYNPNTPKNCKKAMKKLIDKLAKARLELNEKELELGIRKLRKKGKP